jgi:hypothetical protein
MAHYAFLDSNNVVNEVIVGKDESDTTHDWEKWYGEFRGQVCKRTSYNTLGDVHIGGGVPFRKNYAGIGFTYDEQRDAFIPPKPYPSWVLDEAKCQWEAPIFMPNDDKPYVWDEASTSWQELTTINEPT